MAKLILSMEGLVLKEITLTKERTTIGRKPHNDIQIDNLAVSGEHAVIVTILNDSFLEDLGSTNGTLVNGQPVKKHFLQSNDVIELGKYKLKYLGDQLSKAPLQPDFEKTMVLRPAAAGSPGEPQKPADAPKAAAAPQAAPAMAAAAVGVSASQPIKPMSAPHAAPSRTSGPAMPAARPMAAAPSAAIPGAKLAAIQVLSGANAGREMELTKALTTLGKPGVQVAVITKRPQGYYITHVEGANFPIVNGRLLDAQAHPLNDHDIVELAGVKMESFYQT